MPASPPPLHDHHCHGTNSRTRALIRQRRPIMKPTRKRPQGRTSRSASSVAEEPVRLNKAIADAGIASRRHADDLIAAGRVRINGEVVTELGIKVSTNDVVSVDGEQISRRKHLTYVLLNKPKDVISTSSDERGRTTVFDIVRIHDRLFTVGRLDRNTTGVLLITNDGDLAHRLMHPRHEVPRSYKVKLDRDILPAHARKISGGIDLDDGPTQPCEVLIDPKDKSVVHMVIREGRNREVRRIFEAMGYEVRGLDRKQYAFLTARGLKRGEYRHLSSDEVHELRTMVGLEA